MLLSGKIWNAISRKATDFVQLIRFCVSFTHVIILNFCQYPIRNSTMTNGIVLDPFLGSGSTLIAGEKTDHVCRGIEFDPKFVDVIVKWYIVNIKWLFCAEVEAFSCPILPKGI